MTLSRQTLAALALAFALGFAAGAGCCWGLQPGESQSISVKVAGLEFALERKLEAAAGLPDVEETCGEHCAEIEAKEGE